MTRTGGGRSTRGSGILENTLADWRCRVAESLLRASACERGDHESTLDIGCGGFPRLLDRSDAALRVGLDCQNRDEWADVVRESSIRLLVHDLAAARHLPLRSATFNSVSLLAVIEHLGAAEVAATLREAHRVLLDEGRLVITAPSVWGHALLGPMSRAGLVSREEIEEHKRGYTPAGLKEALGEAGFHNSRISSGYFQLGMNCWAVAQK